MIINHNMNALNAHRNMGINNGQAAKSMEKLSSGLRINRAGDDAAGLSISEKMRGQIRGLSQASRNSQDGISMIQTAEGALSETHSILQRMRELAVQAGNDTNVTADRSAIAEEMEALQQEITRIAGQTEFNTKNMFSTGATVTFQVGANKDQTISVSFGSMSAGALGVAGMSVSVSTQPGATGAISTIDAAIKEVSSERSKLGAVQNRLEHTIANVDNAQENLTAAESRVRDVDMAKEMMAFQKNNILQQAAQSMLSQANQQPQNVLSLLR
ncbi:flagellin [Clostridium sp. SM-530-WT-3G]|uniref:flagellin N-terminal helical domain-containing protein n=1 Tax=Clostridium sp. SM-530-WT-3G TaxID=2725303 RepID=UPI00145C6DE8|nr:flagellin [Clostridium sp. SM-530-WT-3G]NME82791.1 flagellin [Clostridium sp. SM-530-WT-3G]